MTYILLALAILLVLISNHLKPKPLKRSLFTMPVILLIYAVYLASDAHVQSGEAISLAISLILGGVVGMIQGKIVKVYQEHGVWWVAGSFVTLLIWLISIPIRLIVKYGYIQLLHVPTVLTGKLAYVPFLFSLAGILIGKVFILSLRYPKQMKAAANDEYRTSRRRARRARREFDKRNEKM
jgi:hypothetical protein